MSLTSRPRVPFVSLLRRTKAEVQNVSDVLNLSWAAALPGHLCGSFCAATADDVTGSNCVGTLYVREKQIKNQQMKGWIELVLGPKGLLPAVHLNMTCKNMQITCYSVCLSVYICICIFIYLSVVLSIIYRIHSSFILVSIIIFLD